MFTFNPPQKNESTPSHFVAVAAGEDIAKATSTITLRHGLTKPELAKATAPATDKLAAKHRNTVWGKRGDTWVVQGEVEPLGLPHGDCVQLWGKNQFTTLHPDREARAAQSVLICGNPGSGKSVWAAAYAREFAAFYPEARILVFSRKNFSTEEPAFDDIEYQQFDIMSDDLVDNPISVDDIRQMQANREHKVPVLALFDDVGPIAGAAGKAVRQTLNELLLCGRSMGVTVVCTAHAAASGQFTKSLWDAVTHCVLFPSAHPEKVIACLENRLKLRPAVVDFLMDQPTRWLCLSLSTPSYALMQHMLISLPALTKHLKKVSK